MERISKGEITVGDYVMIEWKGKIYAGKVIKIDSDEWARKTGGKFIAISIKNARGKVIGMPYTSRGKYYRMTKEEFEKRFVKNMRLDNFF